MFLDLWFETCPEELVLKGTYLENLGNKFIDEVYRIPGFHEMCGAGRGGAIYTLGMLPKEWLEPTWSSSL